MKNNKFLFAIDLDGTLLKDSSNGEISPLTTKGIKRAIKAGHYVCIVTGRP
jgi:hydroxymethylpyrimidine pyrophosphatase-like HAD family hydrolase